mmetsp:Transcript_16737/g.33829  ORF Transcript_16737/g.33829 Transcript_16737/m.33829 type:complete len:214 (+) Transcript_16737:2748-3389(+)
MERGGQALMGKIQDPDEAHCAHVRWDKARPRREAHLLGHQPGTQHAVACRILKVLERPQDLASSHLKACDIADVPYLRRHRLHLWSEAAVLRHSHAFDAPETKFCGCVTRQERERRAPSQRWFRSKCRGKSLGYDDLPLRNMAEMQVHATQLVGAPQEEALYRSKGEQRGRRGEEENSRGVNENVGGKPRGADPRGFPEDSGAEGPKGLAGAG